MKTIWKFTLEITDQQEVSMPAGAEILTAQFQGGDALCLWAIVSTATPITRVKRVFEIFGTGNPIPVGRGIERKYIATAQELGRPLVWHVFEGNYIL